jgi:hypothetical protein
MGMMRRANHSIPLALNMLSTFILEAKLSHSLEKEPFLTRAQKEQKKNLHLDSTQKKVFSFVFWIFANGETVAPADREPLLIRWPGFLASPLPLAS